MLDNKIRYGFRAVTQIGERWTQMYDVSKQPYALCLVDQLHHHRLDCMHITYLQVHHSDHIAM